MGQPAAGNDTHGPRQDAARSAIARAEATERFFWWRVAAILAVMVTVGSMGVWRVQERSSGVRTAYKLARLHDALREQVELNRRLEARLTHKKEPNRLQQEASVHFGMRTPRPNETWEIQPQ